MFTAIVLICTLSTPPSDCTENTAIDVIKTGINTELGCARGWQEIIARGSLREGIGKDLYLKSICHRRFAAKAPVAR